MESVARVIDLNVARNIEITENKHEHLETKLDRFVTNIVSEEEYNEGNHFADSLESIDDINNMILALSKRDYSSMVLFIVGINTGYRPVDLLAWRWKHIVENGKFLRTFAMPEHKTGKTALVNLNETTIKILTWFMEYKMCNEIDFSMENFVFSSMKNKGQKTFLYLEKETNKMWHTNKASAIGFWTTRERSIVTRMPSVTSISCRTPRCSCMPAWRTNIRVSIKMLPRTMSCIFKLIRITM